MHHFVFGINSTLQIHFISLASLASVHLIIYLSTHPSHLCLHHVFLYEQIKTMMMIIFPTQSIITYSLFHSKLKAYLFNKSFPP